MSDTPYDKLSILLIEDEVYTRSLLRQILIQIGVRSIGEAANGKDGLMEIVRTRPDIVFCDVHMKPMNGLQVLQGMRNIKVKGVDRTPFIMLTADNQAETVRTALEHQVNGYLVKPVSLAQMKDRIDKVYAAEPEMREWVKRR
ncbi:response regulator [Azospirillum sp. YIM B02556]|uniref:Response regulator n=1 Tax=Azospirillum endophyticum TaxID=2800326 RepID=A0ABS1F642_9PROT|nr:response regulator [Azospirillum endophyticum]MBK1838910.1 response regulator [Azospirillum endophyticum]